MARYLFFGIILIGTGVLSPAGAMTGAWCQNRAANCVGRCANPGGGTYQNKCMSYCTRQSISCLARAHDEARRWWRQGYEEGTLSLR
jgi:hypothetical protein